MAQTSVERIVAEIQGLSPQERLRLIRTVVDTLIMPGRPAESLRLIYGEFRGGRMSTEDDFRIVEWRPQDRGMNGP
jgi:methyl coenzyme M reductase gamma subunit